MLVLCSIPKVVGSIPTVAGHIFQARPVWIYTQSNITNIIFTWVHNTNTEKIILLDYIGIEGTNITYSNRPDRVAQLAEHWASIPKVVGSIPTVAGHQASITFFRACERNSKCACKNTSYLDFVT